METVQCHTGIWIRGARTTESAIAVAWRRARRPGFAYAAAVSNPCRAVVPAGLAGSSAEGPTGPVPKNAGPPASNASGIRRHASRGAIAPAAAGIRTSRTAGCVSGAASASAAETASGTPRRAPRAGSTEVATSNPSAALPAGAPESASSRGASPRSASVAGSCRRWRPDRAARRVLRTAVWPTGRPIPNAGQKADVPAAPRPRSRACRRAGRAWCCKPGTRGRNGRPPGAATPNGAPPGSVLIAAAGRLSAPPVARRARWPQGTHTSYALTLWPSLSQMYGKISEQELYDALTFG